MQTLLPIKPSTLGFEGPGQTLLLMIYILHYLKDPKEWELPALEEQHSLAPLI